ncbi:hypothetical protein BgiBS90_035803, partial [Biomphalaria glabrata]
STVRACTGLSVSFRACTGFNSSGLIHTLGSLCRTRSQTKTKMPFVLTVLDSTPH